MISQNVPFLRCAVLFCLVCSTILFGVMSYFVFYNQEGKLLHSQYDSIKEQFRSRIASEINVQKRSLLTNAVYLESEFPEASHWPSAAVPLDTFTKLSTNLLEISDLRTLLYAPIINASEIELYNNFTEDLYAETGLMTSDIFAFGLGRINEVDASSAQGTRQILVPILELTDSELPSSFINFNMYSGSQEASAIDFVLDNCTSSVNNTNCIAAAEFLFYGTPSITMMKALYVTDTYGNSIPVGITAAIFEWEDLLDDSVPAHADGLEVVVVTEEATEYVYQFDSGHAVLQSREPSSDHSASFVVDIDLLHSRSTIKLSYTDEFVAQYRTQAPFFASVIAVSISLLISTIFIIYDLAINREKQEKAIIAETKRLFVRYISHEIRTPLNTVHLGLQVLYEEMRELIDNGDLDQFQLLKEAMNEWTNFISCIDSSTEDAITVVSDLIDFDKLTTGMLNIERGIHDIWGLITDTVKPFSVQARSKSINLNCNFPLHQSTEETHDDDHHRAGLKLLVTYGDDIKIQQVVRNLISNALKFTLDGGELKISGHWNENYTVPENALQRLVVPEGYELAGGLDFRVRDYGAGMTTEQVDQLFQEGVQFDANKLQAGQGSGLGLWISKGVVEQHCGQLSATSEGKGHGSEFLFQLPLFRPRQAPSPLSVFSFNPSPKHHRTLPLPHREKQNLSEISAFPTSRPMTTDSLSSTTSSSPIDKHQSTPSPLSKSFSWPGKAKKFLIVDDAASSRKMMCRLLKNAGCRTAEASNGQECLDMVAKEQFDLILMDFEMPIMNGPTATNKLCELGCKTPVVGLTGNVGKEDLQFFIDQGAVEVLIKPLNVSELVSMTKRVFFEPPPCPSQTTERNSSRSILFVTNEDTTQLAKAPSSSSIPTVTDVTDDRPKHILVVDDVPSTRKVISRLLKNCGCTTAEAADGQECLDMVAKEQFDLILMDYEMPIMNGPTATNKLRKLGCKIPVVGVTGNVLKSDLDFFLEQGALEVLQKPVKVKVIRDLLKKRVNLNSKTVLVRHSESESEGAEWFMMALNL